MPVSRRVARFNRVVTNRVAIPLAGRLPGLGLVRHRGRRSGNSYRTPVLVFRDAEGFVIPLFYGVGSDWVRNVTAAGGCEVQVRGRWVGPVQPRLFHDESRRVAPPVLRPALRLVKVADFLRLTSGPERPAGG